MDFFIHTTKASDAAKLKKLQDDYKLAGLGFYWKVVELLMLCPTKVHFNTILTLREPPISFNKVKAILNDYDLFVVDENNYVTLKVDKENGIGEKSLESYLSFFTSSSRASDASHESRASSHTSSGASSGASLRPGHCDIDKEKIRVEIEAQKQFDSFMEARCPHLLLMEEPLTLDDYRKLKTSYTWGQIQEVRLDMENDNNLYQNKRNGYRTALSWLKRRYKTNDSKGF